MGGYSNWRRKVCVLIVGDCERGALLDVLAELFVPQQATSFHFMHVVVMLEGEAFRLEDKRFWETHRFYRTRLTYIRGSVFSEDDLVRASAHRAEMKAALVLAHRHDGDDSKNLARVLALRRHLPLLPLYVMLRNSSNAHFLAAAGVQSSNVLQLDTVRFGELPWPCSPLSTPLPMRGRSTAFLPQ